MVDLERLEALFTKYGMTTPGELSGTLQINRILSQATLPIDPRDYRTPKGGQVALLNGDREGKILAEHGITRSLTSQGGRTTRSTIGILEDYADIVNELEPTEDEFAEMELFWIEKIKEYFNRTPLKYRSDTANTPTAAIEDLFKQARARESGVGGATYAGTLLQNLVAAKLRIIAPDITVHGTSTADAPTSRAGDFEIGDASIHCTTAPMPALIEKCRDNLSAGVRPIIITIHRRVQTARDMAEDAGIGPRVEVWDVTQFLSANIWEHGTFARDGRRATIEAILTEYNDIVDTYENDPSMKITL